MKSVQMSQQCLPWKTQCQTGLPVHAKNGPFTGSLQRIAILSAMHGCAQARLCPAHDPGELAR